MQEVPTDPGHGQSEGAKDDPFAEIDKTISVGVCCMEKKLKSKPMQSIMGNLDKYSEL